MIEAIQKTKEYLIYIQEHYYNVQKAWQLIQDKCAGQCFPFLYDDHKFFGLDASIKEHDASKLSHEEFIPYRIKFFPTKQEKETNNAAEISSKDTGFEKAWEHHKIHNAHHWENWTWNIGMYNELDLVHNICDWMAMGMAFNDTAKDYYEKNKDKIKLPKWATKFMYEIFDCVYGK